MRGERGPVVFLVLLAIVAQRLPVRVVGSP